MFLYVSSCFRKEYNKLCWVCTLSEAITCIKSHPNIILLTLAEMIFLLMLTFVCIICLIRGVIGELDEELDASLDFSKLRAHPLKPVMH